MAHSEEFWQNEVHWKRKWQPTPVFMPQEPHEHYENAKEDMTSGDKPRRSECVQYALGKSGEIAQERMKRLSQSKKKHPVVDVTDHGSKVQCCKEQYCIGTWNVRSMNKGKLEVVKQKMTRVNINILGISELKWTRMGKFNSDDPYIYFCGQ